MSSIPATPACFSLDLNFRSRNRSEICNEPSMVVTSFSTLNLYQDFGEKFTIQAKEHQSIDIFFIEFYVVCYTPHCE